MISRVYVEALRRIPEARLVGVVSRRAESARRFATELGLEVASDRLDDLLAAVDVVCVNSPNARHAEHAIAAARAGRHVVVEKPLATNLEEARAMIAACADARVGLAYAEELAFVPKLVRAREILASGALGDPLYVTQREAHAGPYSPWFFSRDEAGGGVAMDLLCHSIECVRWLLGKPAVRSVTARIANLRPERGPLDDHAVLQLEFESGPWATLEASWLLQGGMQSTLEIWGTRGTLRVDLLGETGLRLFTPDGSPAHLAQRGWATPLHDWVAENGYEAELRHFLGAFRRGETPAESGSDGLAVLEILYAAYASAREDRTLGLPYQPAGVERAVDLWLRAPQGTRAA
jgi:predicted dehydrogenase